jgi:hypothetical protein
LQTKIPIEIIEKHGNSAFVQFEISGMPRRSYVDVADIVDGECPQERLEDVPYGIDWASFLKFDGKKMAREIEQSLKAKGIWTLADLQQKDRVLIRIATDLIGEAVWDVAKQQDKRTNS